MSGDEPSRRLGEGAFLKGGCKFVLLPVTNDPKVPE